MTYAGTCLQRKLQRYMDTRGLDYVEMSQIVGLAPSTVYRHLRGLGRTQRRTIEYYAARLGWDLDRTLKQFRKWEAASRMEEADDE